MPTRTTTEPPTDSEVALSVASPTRRPVLVMRTAQIGRPGEAQTFKGLSLCERRKLRRQGFTAAEIEFMNALEEINQMV